MLPSFNELIIDVGKCQYKLESFPMKNSYFVSDSNTSVLLKMANPDSEFIFLDSSSNNRNIIENGDISQGIINNVWPPFGDGYGQFTGGGDLNLGLTPVGDPLQFPDDTSWCIETMIYPTAVGHQNIYFYSSINILGAISEYVVVFLCIAPINTGLVLVNNTLLPSLT